MAVAAAKHSIDPRRYFESVDAASEKPEHEPVCLYLETTNRCNLLCTTCPRTYAELEPPADMSWQLFTSIVDQIPHLTRAVLHGAPRGGPADPGDENHRRRGGQAAPPPGLANLGRAAEQRIQHLHRGDLGPRQLGTRQFVKVIVGQLLGLPDRDAAQQGRQAGQPGQFLTALLARAQVGVNHRALGGINGPEHVDTERMPDVTAIR